MTVNAMPSARASAPVSLPVSGRLVATRASLVRRVNARHKTRRRVPRRVQLPVSPVSPIVETGRVGPTVGRGHRVGLNGRTVLIARR